MTLNFDTQPLNNSSPKSISDIANLTKVSYNDGPSFCKHIINLWNSLSGYTLYCQKLVTFKYKVSKLHFSDYFASADFLTLFSSFCATYNMLVYHI